MIEKPTKEQIKQAEKAKRICRLAIKKQLSPLEKEIDKLSREIYKQQFANMLEGLPDKILLKLENIKKKLKALSGMSFDDVYDEYNKRIQKRIRRLRKQINFIEKILISKYDKQEFYEIDKFELELEDLEEEDQINYAVREKYNDLELKKLRELDLLTGENNAQKKQMEAIEKQLLGQLNLMMKNIMLPITTITKVIPSISIPGFEDLSEMFQMIPTIVDQLEAAEKKIEEEKNKPPETKIEASDAAKNSLKTKFKEVSDYCDMPDLSPEFQKKLSEIDDAILNIMSLLPSLIANTLVLIVNAVINLQIPVVGMSLLDIAGKNSIIGLLPALIKLVPMIPSFITNMRPQAKKIIENRLKSIQRLKNIAKFMMSGDIMDEFDKIKAEASMDACPLKEQQDVNKLCDEKKKIIEELKKKLNELKAEQQKLASQDVEDLAAEEKKKQEEKEQKKKEKEAEEESDEALLKEIQEQVLV